MKLKKFFHFKRKQQQSLTSDVASRDNHAYSVDTETATFDVLARVPHAPVSEYISLTRKLRPTRRAPSPPRHSAPVAQRLPELGERSLERRRSVWTTFSDTDIISGHRYGQTSASENARLSTTIAASEQYPSLFRDNEYANPTYSTTPPPLPPRVCTPRFVDKPRQVPIPCPYETTPYLNPFLVSSHYSASGVQFLDTQQHFEPLPDRVPINKFGSSRSGTFSNISTMNLATSTSRKSITPSNSRFNFTPPTPTTSITTHTPKLSVVTPNISLTTPISRSLNSYASSIYLTSPSSNMNTVPPTSRIHLDQSAYRTKRNHHTSCISTNKPACNISINKSTSGHSKAPPIPPRPSSLALRRALFR